MGLDTVSRNHVRLESISTVFLREKEPGFLFSGEAHALPELIYVDQGSLHCVVDGEDLLLEQGDMVLCDAGQFCMQYAEMGETPRFLTVTFQVPTQELAPLLRGKIRASTQVSRLLEQMIREQTQADDFSAEMTFALFTQLLLTLRREYTEPAQQPKSAASLRGENAIIRRAQLYISSHVRQKLSVPMVARMVDVSTSYLTALFHKRLQISPGEYIRRVKLQESKQMIRDGSMNFTEIAAALNYSTVHHFSRQFKEKFGMTPTEYARSVRS